MANLLKKKRGLGAGTADAEQVRRRGRDRLAVDCTALEGADWGEVPAEKKFPEIFADGQEKDA